MGALNLNATYFLANKKLQAENEIGLGQFKVGNEIEGIPVISVTHQARPLYPPRTGRVISIF
jgi:hypothetical protein